MNHIELALNVLRKEISTLNHELKYGSLGAETEEETMLKLQKLHRAINDIQKGL